MKLEERASRTAIGAVRIVAGLLWLANVHWKRPTDFGRGNGSGLFKYVQYGIDHPTLPPFSWALEHLVKPNMTAFGWFTLVTESMLAALLILGWRTRLVALAAAGQAAAIGLSVAQAPNEWPWSYVLMIGVHLLLAATAAGMFGGLDGLRARGAGYRSAVAALGAVAVLVGLAGIIAAADDPFTNKSGSLVGQRSYELKFVWFNLLAALVCIGIGALALLGWKARRREPVVAAAVVAALCALQVVVQWRTGSGGETGGILGGNGGTFALWLTFGIGLGIASRRVDA